MICPTHLRDHVVDASNAFPLDASNGHRYFKIFCACGSTRFRFERNGQKTVRGECVHCGEKITVYDLAFYPAAMKLSGDAEYRELDDSQNQEAVFVMFEYAEPEPDVEFDENDVTWCQIFVQRNNGRIEKIFDDETC